MIFSRWYKMTSNAAGDHKGPHHSQPLPRPYANRSASQESHDQLQVSR